MAVEIWRLAMYPAAPSPASTSSIDRMSLCGLSCSLLCMVDVRSFALWRSSWSDEFGPADALFAQCLHLLVPSREGNLFSRQPPAAPRADCRDGRYAGAV